MRNFAGFRDKKNKALICRHAASTVPNATANQSATSRLRVNSEESSVVVIVAPTLAISVHQRNCLFATYSGFTLSVFSSAD